MVGFSHTSTDSDWWWLEDIYSDDFEWLNNGSSDNSETTDDTVANTVLPDTGINIIICAIILATTLICTVAYNKHVRYSGIDKL